MIRSQAVVKVSRKAMKTYRGYWTTYSRRYKKGFSMIGTGYVWRSVKKVTTKMPEKTKRQRRARDLYSIASEDYSPKEGSNRKDVVDGWLAQLQDDAEFNIDACVDCFLSENLARRYIEEKKVTLSDPTKAEAKKWRENEDQKKRKANLSYAIRRNDAEIDYLGMDSLAFLVEGRKGASNENSLTRDAIEYAPVRNVVGHTGLLTDNGKKLLSLKYQNIKARIKTLVVEGKAGKKKTKKKRR